MKNDQTNQRPKARKDQLIVKEVSGETLVYDLDRNKAHCLNRTAALVWKNCDGRATVRSIARSIQRETDAAIDDRVVWLALDQLEKFDLMQRTQLKPAHLNGMSSRQLVRYIGVAAIALPVVVSISAPTAVSAASCLANNFNCSVVPPLTLPCCPPFTCKPNPPGGPKCLP